MAITKLTPHPEVHCHEMTIVLGDTQFVIRFTWRKRSAAWYMALYELDGTPVWQGRRVTPGLFVGEGIVVSNGPDGSFLVDGHDPYEQLDLGNDVNVNYVPNDDILPVEDSTPDYDLVEGDFTTDVVITTLLQGLTTIDGLFIYLDAALDQTHDATTLELNTLLDMTATNADVTVKIGTPTTTIRYLEGGWFDRRAAIKLDNGNVAGIHSGAFSGGADLTMMVAFHKDVDAATLERLVYLGTPGGGKTGIGFDVGALKFISNGGDLDVDYPIGAGCIATLRSSTVTDDAHCFLNGVAVGSVPDSRALSGPLYISDSTVWAENVSLALVAIWDRELTDREIQNAEKLIKHFLQFTY